MLSWNLDPRSYLRPRSLKREQQVTNPTLPHIGLGGQG